MDKNEELTFLGKFKKKKILLGIGGRVVGGSGGFERRIEVIVKIKKKLRGVGGAQVGVGLVGGQGGCE